MTDFASGHRAEGAARRSALRAIQSIVPCRPSARNVARCSPERSAPEACANFTASKPQSFAKARMDPRGSSGVELGIMRYGRLAGDAIGEQGAEGGPRFHLHIPFGRDGELRPRHLA